MLPYGRHSRFLPPARTWRKLSYGEAMKEPTQFLVNEKGEKVAVVIGIQEYEKLLEQLEELEDIRAFDEAEASGETPIPFDQAVAQIKRSRK